MLAMLAVTSLALRTPNGVPRQPMSRRDTLGLGLGLGLSGALPVLPALATDEVEQDVEVYFGCGCFWHVQHEFVMAEQQILGRKNAQLTSLSGYAGGVAGARDGRVCYHNAGMVSDYGSLGHAEVVRLRVPPSQFSAFAEEYCKLFDKNGKRPDQDGDRGLEYRNLVGIPGGTNSPLAKELVAASIRQGDKLDFARGKGDDPDVRGTVFVMDTETYPFFVGEAYHQFHDGFAWGEDYPNSYNGLVKTVSRAGNLPSSTCPNGLLGIGLAGL